MTISPEPIASVHFMKKSDGSVPSKVEAEAAAAHYAQEKQLGSYHVEHLTTGSASALFRPEERSTCMLLFTPAHVGQPMSSQEKLNKAARNPYFNVDTRTFERT